jgi:hypothetical protein
VNSMISALRHESPKHKPLGFNPKVRGELTELAFLLKAATLQLRVSKQYGDSRAYDFIVDCDT